MRAWCAQCDWSVERDHEDAATAVSNEAIDHVSETGHLPVETSLSREQNRQNKLFGSPW